MANILSFKVVFSFCQFKRFRPVLMTALAMIIGMLPMAIEPGQNAPLGRAVIGGLAHVRHLCNFD